MGKGLEGTACPLRETLTPSIKGGVIGELRSPTFIPRSAVEARRKTPSVNITL